MSEAKKTRHRDKIPGVIQKKRSQKSPSYEQMDDHVKSWKLIRIAKQNMWTPAIFARKQCEEWKVPIEEIHKPFGSREIANMRFILTNRIKAAYPHLSSTQIGKILKKSHSTILFIMGELEWRKPTLMGGLGNGEKAQKWKENKKSKSVIS